MDSKQENYYYDQINDEFILKRDRISQKQETDFEIIDNTQIETNGQKQ